MTHNGGKVSVNFDNYGANYDYPLIDACKMAGAGWLPLNTTDSIETWTTYYDSRGYPTQMPGGSSPQPYWTAFTQIFAYVGDVWVLTWTGTATFALFPRDSFTFGVGANPDFFGNGQIINANRIEYTITGATQPIGFNDSSFAAQLYIGSMSANTFAGGSIKLFRKDFESNLNAGQVFLPPFLTRVQKWGRIRFMKWMVTWEQVGIHAPWALRPPTDSFTYYANRIIPSINCGAVVGGSTPFLHLLNQPPTPISSWTDGTVFHYVATSAVGAPTVTPTNRFITATDISHANPSVITVGQATGSLAPLTLTISSGSYVSGTGVITLSVTNSFSVGDTITTALSGTGNIGSLNGIWSAISPTNASTLTLQGPTGAGSVTISAGQVTSTAPSVNSTITLNGTVVTFVSGTPSGNQVQIGSALTVTAVSSGALAVGQTISGAGIPGGVVITSYAGGTTYYLNQPLTIASENMTSSGAGSASFTGSIALNISATIVSLMTFLNASADTQISKCLYYNRNLWFNNGVVGITFKTPGTGGNSFTLAASSTPTSAFTVSASTLTGGNTSGHGLTTGDSVQFPTRFESGWLSLSRVQLNAGRIWPSVTVIDANKFSVPIDGGTFPLDYPGGYTFNPTLFIKIGSLPSKPCQVFQGQINFPDQNPPNAVYNVFDFSSATEVLVTGIYDATLDIIGLSQNNIAAQMPIEQIVALTNIVNCHPHLNVPIEIDDSTVASFADYLRDNLNPGLVPIIEYDNESWFIPGTANTSDQQAARAAALFGGNGNDYFGFRTGQISDIFKTEYTGSGKSYRIAMGQWIAGPSFDSTYTINRYLCPPVSGYVSPGSPGDPTKYPINKCHEICVAPYFSVPFIFSGAANAYPDGAGGTWADQVYKYTQGGASRTAAFQWFRDQHIFLSNDPINYPSQSLHYVRDSLLPFITTPAVQYNVNVSAYEGGVGWGGKGVSGGFPCTAPISGQPVSLVDVDNFVQDFMRSQQFADVVNEYCNEWFAVSDKYIFPNWFTVASWWGGAGFGGFGYYWGLFQLNDPSFQVGVLNTGQTPGILAFLAQNGGGGGVTLQASKWSATKRIGRQQIHTPGNWVPAR